MLRFVVFLDHYLGPPWVGLTPILELFAAGVCPTLSLHSGTALGIG